jgi:hypothetical protein
MKARQVEGLEPDEPLADNVERLVRVRLDELCGFMPKASDPGRVRDLHDMRIAAKRLRYLLELFAPLFGTYAATAAKRTKELQDLIGEIHDCDVTLPRVEGLVEEMREHDAADVRRLAGDAADLDPALVARAPHAEAFRGLETMAVYLRARRQLLFERFLVQWTDLERHGFAARLAFAMTERAPAPDPEPDAEPEWEADPAPAPDAETSSSHGGNGSGTGSHVPSPWPPP